MFDSPQQFLPLLPAEHLLGSYLERASAIANQAAELGGLAHSSTRAALHELLRNMNSYYSNRIEGQSTTPRNIEAALHDEYSDRPEIAQLQRIAVAHIEAEKRGRNAGRERLSVECGVHQDRSSRPLRAPCACRPNDQGRIGGGARKIAENRCYRWPPSSACLAVSAAIHGAFTAHYDRQRASDSR